MTRNGTPIQLYLSDELLAAIERWRAETETDTREQVSRLSTIRAMLWAAADARWPEDRR